MKNFFIILSIFSLVFLASCKKDGEKTVETTTTTETKAEINTEETEKITASTEEETKTEEKIVAEGDCDRYIEYLACTYKKMNMDEETIKSNLEVLKTAWQGQDKENMEQTCKDNIKVTKEAGLMEGCDL